MKCLAAAALILCTVPMAEARRPAPERLPISCAQVKELVRMAGSVQAAEIYAAQNGIRLTPAQRRAAIACLSRR